MRRTLLPLCLALSLGALGACSKPAEEAAKKQAEAKTAIDSAPRPQPGQYRTTVTITDVSFPGMPAQMAQRMEGMFGTTGHTVEFCLTPEKASSGYEEFNRQAAKGDCKYESLSLEGGKLDARMTCQTGRGMTSKTHLTGTYSPTGSQLAMETQAEMPGVPGGGMAMKAQVTNERIGDCK